MGKKLILNSNILQPILNGGFDAQAEYAVLRNITISGSFSTQNGNFIQKLDAYKAVYGNFPAEKGSIHADNIAVQANWYINQSFAAPLGWHAFMGYGRGFARMKGNFYKVVSETNTQLNEYLTYDIRNIQTEKFEIGAGYQWIFMRRLTLKPQLALTLATVNAGEKFDYTLIGIANNYGANLINGGQWQAQKFGNIGLSAYLRVGFLLF